MATRADPERLDAERLDPERLDGAALRVLVLSSLGGALEFYDFVVFGVFGAYISAAFFPAADPAAAQVQTLAVFAAGYLARPIGGLVFGRRGDRRGRRGSFLLSLGVMSAATAAMGLVPGHATGGLASTAAFVALRLVQGFCLGGELPGAITYAVEAAPRRHAALACGLVFGCVSGGVLLATGVSLALHGVLGPAGVADWGWRLAFLLGGALGGVSWALRRTLEESPAFLRMKARAGQDAAAGDAAGPLASLMRRHRGQLLAAIAATGIVALFNGLLFAHMAGYLVRLLAYPPASVSAGLNIAAGVTAVALVAATWVADRWSALGVFRIGCAVLMLGAMPAYQALAAHGMALGPLFVLIGLSAACTHGTFAFLLADLFPTSVRFSGVALAMNLGAVLFSALGPLLAGALIAWTGWLAAPGALVVAGAALALAASAWLPRLSGWLGAPEGEGPRDRRDADQHRGLNAVPPEGAMVTRPAATEL